MTAVRSWDRNTRSYGDVVRYLSPSYGEVLTVRLSTPIITPHGEPGYDAVIINEEGEPDIEGHFFTSVWLDESQIIPEGGE